MPGQFTTYGFPPPLPPADPALPPPVVDLAWPPSPSPYEGAHEAVRAWHGHVVAGRIGAPAPTPPPTADGRGDLRLASLAAILGFDAGHAA